MTKKPVEEKRILAQYDEQSIRVYQAYNPYIAAEAVKLGTFGSQFKMERMTWIKPSFLWMMYRSGWGSKEGQERILAIDIKRSGFDSILNEVVLSTYNARIYGDYEAWKERLIESQVRCQWDPDRDIYGNPIDRRAIQLGLRGSMITKYVNSWIVNITDITCSVAEIKKHIQAKTFINGMLPKESEYPLDEKQKKILGITY